MCVCIVATCWVHTVFVSVCVYVFCVCVWMFFMGHTGFISKRNGCFLMCAHYCPALVMALCFGQMQCNLGHILPFRPPLCIASFSGSISFSLSVCVSLSLSLSHPPSGTTIHYSAPKNICFSKQVKNIFYHCVKNAVGTLKRCCAEELEEEEENSWPLPPTRPPYNT